jgi:hypothetical protein
MIKVDIPTALSLRETKLLKRLSIGKGVLEIGSLLGYSTVNIAKEARIVTSIDPHEGYPYDGAETTIHKFINNLAKYKVDNVKVHKNMFQDVELGNHDFAFIDLDGTYETTKSVLEYTKDIPLITIHDYGRQGCSGVAEAIRKQGSKIIQVIDTTVIIENKRV